jgi:hypothetical protein
MTDQDQIFELIVMRLADMRRVHPQQIEDVCSECKEPVGIYPSGQLVIERYPNVKITCEKCRTPGPDAKLAPGALTEPLESQNVSDWQAAHKRMIE